MLLSAAQTQINSAGLQSRGMLSISCPSFKCSEQVRVLNGSGSFPPLVTAHQPQEAAATSPKRHATTTMAGCSGERLVVQEFTLH